jgi:hypothetical protein
MRTRAVDGAHCEYMRFVSVDHTVVVVAVTMIVIILTTTLTFNRGISNPIAIKLDSTLDARGLVQLLLHP